MPSAGIDAPIVTGYLTADGSQMIAPNSPGNVAWYEYTPKPGQGGNAVFSGHVDWVGIGPAVFWGLRSAAQGDVIVVDLADGTSLSYRVEMNQIYNAASSSWGQLFLPYAGDDVITLYTCDGQFSGGDYSDRRVVRAARIF